MMVAGVLRVAAFGAATGSRVLAAPAALAWSATSSDPAWVRAPLTCGISALLVAGEAVDDQLNRTKSRLVPVQLIPRFVLATGGGALLAAVATRYDKRQFMYQGTVDIASIRIWLRDPVP
jgi:uncharacterized membrane protein